MNGSDVGRSGMRSGLRHLHGAFWLITSVSSGLTVAFVALTPASSGQEALELTFAGYTDANGLLTAVSFEIIVAFGYTLFRLESYGGLAHRGLHELRRMKAGSDRAHMRRIVEREAVCTLAYVAAIIGSAALVLRFRFTEQAACADLTVAASLLQLLVIGSLQILLYVIISVGVLLERTSIQFALVGLAILVIAPPPGIRPDWLPLHQFDIPPRPDEPALRIGALTVGLAVAIVVALATSTSTATARLRPRARTHPGRNPHGSRD